MLYSLQYDEINYYINLHVECALNVCKSGFMNDEDDEKSVSRQSQGIYCKKVNADIFNNIFDCKLDDKNICIDFGMIDNIYGNNIIALISFLKKTICTHNKNVYLLDVNNSILDKIDSGDKKQVIYSNDVSSSIKIGKNKKELTYEQMKSKPREIFKKKLEEAVEDCTVELDEKCEVHSSVPVYLSRYIDVKEMVQNNAKLFRLGIYYLGLELINKQILSKEYIFNRNTSLFFHTMNGALIATQLAELFGIDMVYLDHLGPLESVHRKHFEKSITDNKKYIIVSDVICLGGEVGRAKTIIEYCGGKVEGEVCIVDISTAISNQKENRISLYTISKDFNPINYLIKTDLCCICEKEKTCAK